jgi:DtxR family Mn-dependent transcriptional regulator
MAANIEVVLAEVETRGDERPGQPLTTLKPGEAAHVVNISPRIRGVERRRLMDLGILPGTLIANEMASAGGDPVGYRVRGAVIALRNSQAELINICREGSQCPE